MRMRIIRHNFMSRNIKLLFQIRLMLVTQNFDHEFLRGKENVIFAKSAFRYKLYRVRWVGGGQVTTDSSQNIGSKTISFTIK